MDDLILFRDDFEGIDRLSDITWRLPDVSVIPLDSTFLGRTQFRLGTFSETLPELQDTLPEVVDGIARLRLDTLNPILLDPPENPLNIDPNLIQPSFFGTDLIINQDFTLGSGLAFEGRVRINAPDPNNSNGQTQRGLVASLFAFFDQGIDDSEIVIGQNIDEIDFEFLTNDINNFEQGISSAQVLTNVYDDEPLGPGNGITVELANLDLTEFNTFRIEWRPDSIRWLVNGTEILNRTDIVPDEAQTIHLNFWAPTADFFQAFDSSLQPVSREPDDTNETLLAQNQTFFYEVDFVQVERLAEPIVDEDFIELFRFRNTNFDTGTYVFVGAAERDAILANTDLNQIFELEGNGATAFTASTKPGEDLLPFFRLQSDVPGTFLFVSTAEYNAIFAEDSNQKDEWTQEGLDAEGNDIPEFYLFGVDAGQGVEFNRFQNRDNNTFLFAGPDETAAINSNPSLSAIFIDQGVAFEAF